MQIYSLFANWQNIQYYFLRKDQEGGTLAHKRESKMIFLSLNLAHIANKL